MAVEDLVIRVRADGALVVRRQLENLGGAARKGSNGVRLLSTALAGLGVGVLVREFVRLADGMTNISNRLKNVTGPTRELNAVMTELFAVSNRTRTSFEANAELYNRLALATKDAGVSQSELLRITETMNQAVVISGLRVQEATNGMIQLSQGLAAGRLNGDELRSVLEQLPPVAQLISDEMGVTRGELRKLGAQGKVTTDVIIRAFQSAEEDIAKRFQKMVPTMGQALLVLRNNIIDMIRSFDNATKVIPQLAQGILFVANNLGELVKVVGLLAFVLGPPVLVAALVAATGAVTAFTLAIVTNPILLLVSLLGLAVGVVVLFGDKIDMASDSMANLQDFGRAVWESIVDGFNMIVDAVSPVFEMIGVEISKFEVELEDVFRAVVTGFDLAFGYANSIVLSAIAVWRSLPAVFQEQMVNLANGGIAVLERFLNEFVRFVVLLPERLLAVITDGVNLMIEGFILFVDFLKGLPDAIRDIFWNAMEGAKQVVYDGINFIGDLFEKIPGIVIPDLGTDEFGNQKDIIVEGAKTVGTALENLAANYKKLREGGDVIAIDRITNDFEGATRTLGEDIVKAFEEGMDMTPGSDWFERTLQRAEELAQMRKDAAAIFAADERNKFDLTTPREGDGLPTSETDVDEKAIKKMQQLKDALADLEMSLDNQVLADAGRVREIENTQADQLKVIKEALEARILTEKQAAERIEAIHQTSARKIRDIEYERYSFQLNAASETFGSLSEIAKGFAGEQSGIYKAMFVASKAFAIADSIIKIQQGIANAMSLPFPANLGAVATVAAQAASIVSNIQAVSLALKDGGPVYGPGTSRSDSIPAMLSNGEFVVNASAAKNNMALLSAINSGHRVSANDSAAFKASASAAGGGPGAVVQIIDQRSRGAAIDVERSTDASGRETIRAIVRDEVDKMYESTARQRRHETINTIRDGQKRGAFFGG